MNASIKNALKSKGPRIIVVDVYAHDWLTDADNQPFIVTQVRDQEFYTPYTAAELREKIDQHGTHEGWVSEGVAYRHQYHCTADVPADIATALHSN